MIEEAGRLRSTNVIEGFIVESVVEKRQFATILAEAVSLKREESNYKDDRLSLSST